MFVGMQPEHQTTLRDLKAIPKRRFAEAVPIQFDNADAREYGRFTDEYDLVGRGL